ncbi:structural maintenance of chromosomes protein 6-like isoform X3 [Orbicella faveolata]|uniref:structural maintenance of chromosomes protein 6-like isoform X3 n=1 Tax=Orbicella faveolata TaxID=48498 RepID=UPI0009E5B510|nr:structural maintenance of chromosomes protein 6-like isoform X3 [Orbicella faveolata]
MEHAVMEHRHFHYRTKSNLCVPFGPRVNFITGRNGSGKSAIMTGLVVALGGRASQTSRGLSIKNFVKKGCRSCQVSVQLRNRGADAFKHSEYGDSIIIERRITADGGSSYKLKSRKGKVVSTQRIQVEQIVDQFNIQVDNPVSLLNQDTSRHLLQSKDESDLYKFFMKATSLEQISTDYGIVMEHKEVALATLQRKEKVIPEVREQVRRLEARYIAIKQIRDIKEQIEELKKERVWAEVIKNEKEVSMQGRVVVKLKSGLPKFDKEIQECEKKISDIEQQVAAVESEMTKVQTEAESLNTEQQHIAAELQERKKTVKDKQSTLRRLQHTKQEAINEKNVLQGKIEEIKTSVEMRNFEEEQRQKEHLLQQKRNELEECKNNLEEVMNKAVKLHNEVETDKYRISKLCSTKDEVTNEIYKMEKQVTRVRLQKSNKILQFGAWMPTLLDRISKAVSDGRFTKPPRGPIGLHLKLKDEKWSRAIESCLKKFGYGFCVVNFKDLKVLKSIITQTTNFSPVVVICPFQQTVYNVSSHKPKCEFPTILDMLEIDDAVIANCLMDQLRIERTLLIESRSHAADVIWSRNAPAKQAFSASGDQLIGPPTVKSVAPDKDFKNYLSTNSADNISALSKEIDEKKKLRDQLAAQKRDLEKALKQRNLEQQEACKEKKRLQASINNLKLEITELMESLEEELSPDITVLETDLEHCTQRLEDLDEQTQTAEQELQQATTFMEDQTRTNDDHERKISEVFEKAEPLKEELESLTAINGEENAKLQHYQRQRRKLEQEIDENEKKQDRLIKLTEQKAEVAMRHFERVETTRSVKDLETEIIQKQKYVQEEEKNRGNLEEIMKEFQETQEKFEAILKNNSNIKKYNKKIHTAMEMRQKYFKEKRKFLASNTSNFFTNHLSRKGYSGYISFDHSRETLNLIVNVHKGPKDEYSEKGVDESTSVMKSLSGGERSVSTISFLTALWGTMESPFRCLDEFDVFMDLCNRKVIMKMVLDIAELPSQRKRQFIFLTPQDLSPLSIDKNVRIFKLADPD